MDLHFRCISSYKALRKLVKLATRSASWWDLYWASDLERLARRTRFEHDLNFRILFRQATFANVPLINWMSEGFTIVLDEYLDRNLPIGTAGEFVASVAFVAFVVDFWSECCEFSYDFLLDTLSIALWHKILMQPMKGTSRSM